MCVALLLLLVQSKQAVSRLDKAAKEEQAAQAKVCLSASPPPTRMCFMQPNMHTNSFESMAKFQCLLGATHKA